MTSQKTIKIAAGFSGDLDLARAIHNAKLANAFRQKQTVLQKIEQVRTARQTIKDNLKPEMYSFAVPYVDSSIIDRLHED